MLSRFGFNDYESGLKHAPPAREMRDSHIAVIVPPVSSPEDAGLVSRVKTVSRNGATSPDVKLVGRPLTNI